MLAPNTRVSPSVSDWAALSTADGRRRQHVVRLAERRRPLVERVHVAAEQRVVGGALVVDAADRLSLVAIGRQAEPRLAARIGRRSAAAARGSSPRG